MRLVGSATLGACPLVLATVLVVLCRPALALQELYTSCKDAYLADVAAADGKLFCYTFTFRKTGRSKCDTRQMGKKACGSGCFRTYQ